MQDYLVFGGVLRSELQWPELRACPPVSHPDWTLARGRRLALPRAASCLGVHRYADDVEVGLWRAGDLWRVTTSDIGDFDLTDAGRRIVWRSDSHEGEELARFDLLGRVLPLALHRGGSLSLHGSAVATPAGAVLLLGAKGRGKSTLALTLAQRGAPLLTDDVAVVECSGTGCEVRPGVHVMRLWPDAAARLGTGDYGPPGRVGRKLVVHSLPSALRAGSVVPLAAVYLLEPAVPAGNVAAAAERHLLRQVDAVRQLLGQVTAGNLLGGAAAPDVLARVAGLARRAPVHVLRLRHDFDQLAAVATTLLDWHREPATAGEAA
ncbi:MAG: phosphoenolpyruvate carboxykinase (ATP) [Gemmatimonadaceae bacterium]